MRLRDLLDGPPPSLPAALDRACEGWWSLPPRLRLALAVTGVVTALIAAPAAVADDSGTVTVLVATRDLLPGQPVQAGDVRQVRRNGEDAPPAAITSLPPDPATAVLVPDGAILTRHHVTTDGLADAIGAGRVAVALPAEQLPQSLRAGQRIDLLAGGPDGQGLVLAHAARIVASDSRWVWVEMGRDEAARVTGAIAWGSVGVGLLPAG